MLIDFKIECVEEKSPLKFGREIIDHIYDQMS
jgi:hypothetical protein